MKNKIGRAAVAGLAAIGVALGLTACGGPDKGTVIGRSHQPATTHYVVGTSGHPGHIVFMPESWTLVLRDGKNTGSKDVSATTWGNCSPGERYPACK